MLRRVFRHRAATSGDLEREMRDEVSAHIALGVESLVRRGVDPVEAERRVRARFGNLTEEMPTLIASAKQRSRAVERREHYLGWFRDARFGLRQLRRSPAFTIGVLFSLGFGLGASATVFSWMEGLVLRPFPAVNDVDRLISVRPELANGWGISVPELDDWRGQSRAVSGLTGVAPWVFAVAPDRQTSTTSDARPVYGLFVSANYFDVLGVRPAHGRAFAAGDDHESAAPTAVVSDALWRQALGASPDAIGELIRVNGQRVRVIGVAPKSFAGTIAGAKFDLWMNLGARPIVAPLDARRWRDRDFRWLDVIGRLRPGVTVTRAHAEFAAIGRRQAAQFVESRGRGVRAIPLDYGTATQLEPLLLTLMVVTALVILLICSNVANLLLTRAAFRHRELAVRLAIGASRVALVRQLLIESAMLAVAGAMLGAGVAWFGQRALSVLMPSSSVTIGAISQFDARFLLFLSAITGTAVLTFGLAPALIGSRIDVTDTLKNGARGSGAHRSRLRTALVIAQFALALSSLVCAAVFLRRDRNVRAMDLGLHEAANVLLVQMEMSSAGYSDVGAWERALDEAVSRVSQVAGVRSTTLATFVPLGFLGYDRRSVEVLGYRTDAGAPDRLLVNGVAPGYFDLMGIPIVAGRAIDSDDRPGRTRAAVVNQAFVSRYFPSDAVLGRRIVAGRDSLTIVGVAKNGKYDYRTIDEPSPPLVYYAWKQAPGPFVTLHVRTSGDALNFVRSIREAIRSVDSSLTLVAPETLARYSSVPFFPSRSGLIVLTVLGAAAMLLAAMGLFSVISYGVAARTREIGIRVALGATRSMIVRMFLRSATALIAAGLAAGGFAAAVFAVILHARIPALPQAQSGEYILPVLVLAVAAIAASLIPAMRASGIDPARTLRGE